jgi:hypothetical protein
MMDTTTLSIPASETVQAEGSSEWSPDELRDRVAQEQALRAIMVDYYRSNMIEKKHYYILQAGQKPALGKEGALNLCSLFKVRVSAADPLEHHHEDGHYSVRYRVRLVSMRTGEGVADGDGFCSTRESKYAYRWVKASDLPGDLDTATLAKRSNRYGSQYRVPTPDLADHYNTVLKMSYKRAIVAAALCLPLVSELFTQDNEESAPPAQSPPAWSAPQRQQTPPAQSHTATTPPDAAGASQQVTPQQLKQLWGRIKAHEVDYETFRDYLKQSGIQSTKALTPAQLEQCFREIDTWQGQAFQPHGVTDAESDTPTPGTRARLFEGLSMLQAVIAEAEETQPPGEPYAHTLIELAQWLPRVARACEHPDTPEDQLKTYLLEVNQSLDQLRKMGVTEAAA